MFEILKVSYAVLLGFIKQPFQKYELLRNEPPVASCFVALCLITFSLAQIIDHYFGTYMTALLLKIDPWQQFTLYNPLDYLNIITHAFMHFNLYHLLGNMIIILAVGPFVERKYGSRIVLGAMIISAALSAAAGIFFTEFGLLGSSGICFCLLAMAAAGNLNKLAIPLGFFLFVILFTNMQIFGILNNMFVGSIDVEFIRSANIQISYMAHLLGGLTGAGAAVYWLIRKENEI